MIIRKYPSAARLRKLLEYRPDTGHLLWLKHPHPSRVGKRAGSKGAAGYRFIRIDKRNWLEHRIIWVWMTGTQPAETIDHKNRIRTDNRWKNLREATFGEQQANRSRPKNAKSPYPGITRKRDYAREKPWQVIFQYKRKQIYCGCFKTPEEAFKAYKAKAKELRGEFFSGAT